MKKNKKIIGKYNRNIFLESFSLGLKPDDPITVSDFVEKFIYLPENSAMPGLINLDITPYFRKPLNDLTPGNGIKKVVVIACVQIGKSQLGLCFALSMMRIAPGNTMVVLPRIGDSEDFSVERLTPILKASPYLASLIKMTGKSSDNKVGKKTYKGGFIYFSGANSGSSFRSKPIRYMYMDEIDEYPLDVEGQGSPIALAENRTVSYKDTKKILYTSTPTDENSAINKEYEKGTQERYFVPCPCCGGFQSLDFRKNLKYETVNNENKELIKESIYYQCDFCDHKIKEVYKRDMLIKGKWIADNPNADFPSYRLNALYSPFITWEDTIKKYLDALRDRQEMKAFINTYLGEIYVEESINLDANLLKKRAEKSNFREMELDPRVICMTSAVDTQDNRLVIDIKGWGKNEECFTILYKEIYGNLNNDEVWNQIKYLVERPYKHPSGIDLYIRYCAIDSGGHFGQKVYDFCSRNPKFKAIKGSSHKQRTLLSAPRKKDINYKGTYRKDGIELYSVGTELAKEEIYYRLKIEEDGARCIHFNKDLDERYFDMLISEKYITKYVGGRETKVWSLPNNKRNESLDTFVYNLAIAKELLHINLLDDIGYEKEYKKMFGDFGVKFINNEKEEELINKENNEKKMENIEKIAKVSKKWTSGSKKGWMKK